MKLSDDQLEIIRYLLNDRINETIQEMPECDLEGKVENCRQVVELDDIVKEINKEMGL